MPKETGKEMSIIKGSKPIFLRLRRSIDKLMEITSLSSRKKL